MRPRSAARPEPADALHHVLVRDLVVPCLIGIHAVEKAAPQRIRVNIALAVRAAAAPGGLEACRAGVIGDVRALLGGDHVNLVETLAERLAVVCLKAPGAVSVRVRVEKLDIFPDAAAAGVEIERLNTPPRR